MNPPSRLFFLFVFLLALGSPGWAAEPILLASPAKAAEVNGKSYDVVVVGATPAGIASAVRAAREGLTVLLTQHNGHIGGMMTNGLVQWDAVYGGQRAPIFNEFVKVIEDYYRKAYGETSEQYQDAKLTQAHYPLSMVEPSVVEREFNRLVAGEKNITLLLKYYPAAVKRDGVMIKGVTFKAYGGTEEIAVKGDVFIDATYEGDLAALAGVPYRVGREGRDEFGEPHAGKIFTNIDSKPGSQDAVEGKINLRPYNHSQRNIDPTSPFTADGAIQAYNYRLVLSSVPENMRLPEKPPGYNREEFAGYNRATLSSGKNSINFKTTYNRPILPGENHTYPEATWEEREKIGERHRNFALGLMYFLQNDESVPEEKRTAYRKMGLALDEYADNGNIPYEMYVREARRITGRYIFREQDNVVAPGLQRTPMHPDSIAMTDWPMDSHACTTDERPDFEFDGKIILTEQSRPAQIPYRSVLATGIDNLLVPVCLSATHVAWGAVRLEPVFMQVGEATGYAAALAKRKGTTPAALKADELARVLTSRGNMVAFFNDVDLAKDAPWNGATQYLGTRGFFNTYNAKMESPLGVDTARQWAATFAKLAAGDADFDATKEAIALPEEEGAPITTEAFANDLKAALKARRLSDGVVTEAMAAVKLQPAAIISRGDALRVIDQALMK